MCPRIASYPGTDGERKTPGIHCLRMRGILTEFWETVYYLFTTVWCKRAVTYFLSMDAHFDGAIEHALRCVGCPNLTLKPEQRQSVRHVYEGKDVFVWLPTGFDKSLCYEMLPFILDVKRATADSALSVRRQYYLSQTVYASTGHYIDCCVIRSYNTW